MEFARPALAGEKHAAMIVDANTGAVLFADDADELRHPASLTKMMTLYMTFELLELGRLSMSDRVTISDNAAAQAPSKLGLEAGETISVSDAIRALVTKSANDVAVALAEKIGGSERNFVRLMNARARDLGMSKTTFQNPSGLPDPNQVTTARDMVTLGMRLQDHFPNYYPLFATRTFAFNRANYRNHNTLLGTFQGIDGIKTGYTRMSGFNLVSSVRRGDRHVVGAVFGGSSAASRNAEMRNLLTRALARASTVKTRKPPPMLIAKLKSEPKIAERPKRKEAAPVQVAEAPKPFAREDAPQLSKVLPPPAAAPDTAPKTIEEAVAQAQDTGAPIDVFKVKRVMVAPRQGPPAPSADETTDMPASDAGAAPFVAASAAPQPADKIAAVFAGGNAPGSETVIPKTRAAVAEKTYDAPFSRPAALGARDTIPNAIDEAPEPAFNTAPAPIAQPQPRATLAVAEPRAEPVERGRPPSSLQAQAAQLPQRVATLQPADYQPQAAASGGRYEVQIGAYGSIDEAQRALASAKQRAGNVLASAGSVTHPVQKAGRTMYRARFSGFDANRASSTCSELRRQSIDCFVMTAE